MRRSWLGTALALGALALSPRAFAQPVTDHLGCYKVKDHVAPRGRFSVTLTNAGVMQTCVVKTPARLGCLETTKSGVTPSPPGGGPSPRGAGNFLCYKLKCPKPSPPAFEMEDQFGRRVVSFRAGQLLCAPAIRGAVVSAPGASTTTTLPPGPCDFNDSDRRCEGTCGNGGHCSATTANGGCECRTTACGDADAPECAGFCQDRDEACTFSITGCSCVRIP